MVCHVLRYTPFFMTIKDLIDRGDDGIVQALYEYLTGTYTGCSVSDIRTSVDNAMIVFAAEEARLQGTVVDLDDYTQQVHSTK